MSRFVLAIAALVFIAGCTPGIRISPAELNTFDPTVKEHIQKREVAIGMSQAAVRYSWGAPIKVDASPEEDREVWVYTKFRVYVYKLTFVNGRLSSASSGVSINRPIPEADTRGRDRRGPAAEPVTTGQTGSAAEAPSDTEIKIEE